MLGLTRTDRPQELLFAWLQGLERASDDWLLAHGQDLEWETIGRVSNEAFTAMRWAVAPE